MLALAGCVGGPPPLADLSNDQRRAALRDLAAADLRLATVAYRIAAAGAAICPRRTPLTGIVLHDSTQYAPALRDAAATLFGFGADVAVLAVAPDSPGQAAGLRAGDRLVMLPSSTLDGPGDASFARVASAYAELERRVADGPVTLDILRAGRPLRLELAPRSGCASRVQLVPDRDVGARADGSVVTVTEGLLRYAADDDELAIVVAHEIAHNALGHRAARGSAPARSTDTRVTERAADRLGYFLAARAGYDVSVAPAFWNRLYRGPAGGLFAPVTHLGRAERVAAAQVAISEIADKRARGQPLTP